MEEKLTHKKITDATNWFIENRPIYERLSAKVQSIIEEIISDQKIPIHAVYSRTKEIGSFVEKIDDPKYINPTTQITDLSGIRIITYVESDLERVGKVLEQYFDVDKENSINKSETLGTDKVGYRSIHYICKFLDARIKLPEYRKFENLKFEIQVRTILQHAWAEIEHDKNYKFSGELPAHLKRRFKVLAGVLELGDREFNEIANEIDEYSATVNKNTKEGNLDITIDSTSLKSYINTKYWEFIDDSKSGVLSENSDRRILEELQHFEIETLKELDNITPVNFKERLVEHSMKLRSYVGIVRILMMASNTDKYFRETWHNSWKTIRSEILEFLKTFNPDFESYIESNDIAIH